MGVLVSVHVPKAGGVSMTRMLRNAFGEAFQIDYAENPANPLSPRMLDPIGYMSRKQTIPWWRIFPICPNCIKLSIRWFASTTMPPNK